jgi:DNA-binding NarL/FixJ family response regulator
MSTVRGMDDEQGGAIRSPVWRVLVVEDHLLVATGVVMALRSAGMVADTCWMDGPDAVLARVRTFEPHVLLLDLVSDGSALAALALIRPLRALGPEVVAFTGATDPVLLGAALEAGACGIIHKRDPIERLVVDVERVARHEELLSPRRRQEYVDELQRSRSTHRGLMSSFTQLTRREAAVLGMMMEGLSADAIAEASFVALTTVRAQIRAVLTKLGVNSQLAAVAMAHKAGWRAPTGVEPDLATRPDVFSLAP